MFQTIVVGVDGRQGGRDALALAAAVPQATGSELIAVHAFPREYFITRGADDHYEAALREAASEVVTGELGATGIAARPVVLGDDSPARALHAVAQREHADLIVVGSAHRGRFGRVLAGDVTAATLQGAPAAVLVAPAGYHVEALQAIGVGFDGSPESRAAVECAHRLAQASGAQLRIIGVIAPMVPGGPYPTYAPNWGEIATGRRTEAQRVMDELVAQLGDDVTGEVLPGSAADELAYEGNDLDLLVVGSRGYGPVQRIVLGSVSTKLVHRAPCPVLVLPRTASSELEPVPETASVAATP